MKIEKYIATNQKLSLNQKATEAQNEEQKDD